MEASLKDAPVVPLRAAREDFAFERILVVGEGFRRKQDGEYTNVTVDVLVGRQVFELDVDRQYEGFEPKTGEYVRLGVQVYRAQRTGWSVKKAKSYGLDFPGLRVVSIVAAAK
jgi:hypothetical protein